MLLIYIDISIDKFGIKRHAKRLLEPKRVFRVCLLLLVEDEMTAHTAKRQESLRWLRPSTPKKRIQTLIHTYIHTYIQLYLDTENHQYNYITNIESIKTVLPDCRIWE